LIRVDLSLPRSAPGINHSAAGLDPSDTLIRIDRVGFIGLDRTRLRRARTDAIDPKESLTWVDRNGGRRLIPVIAPTQSKCLRRVGGQRFLGYGPIGSGASVRHTLRLPFSQIDTGQSFCFPHDSNSGRLYRFVPIVQICRGSHNEVEKFEGR